MILYVVRHGESTHNAENRIQGQSDPSLSELGRRQGARAAEVLRSVPLEAIYSSPLRRAAETAEILARELGQEIRYDDRLMEVHVGHVQDRHREEVMQLHPEVVPGWRSGRLDFRFPGGESRPEVIARGKAAFEEICRAGHRQAIVFSHGGLILAAIKALLDIPSDQPPLALRNASITKLRVTPAEDGTLAAELLDFDNTEHLPGEETGEDW
ncbi:MAG: histidine phosphatase family protein [Planctomycetia bacterium]|jgi:broad specificity phosphatase PhoE